MPKPGQQSSAKVLENFICPDCKAEVTLAQFDEGKSILHPIPMCKTYEKLSAEEYYKLAKELN